MALPSALIPHGNADVQGGLNRLLARVRRGSREAIHVSLPEMPKRPAVPMPRRRRAFRHTLVGLATSDGGWAYAGNHERPGRVGGDRGNAAG